MKPMTVEQERALAKYRIDRDDLNKRSLKIWRQLYTETQLAIAVLKDHFSRGARPDGPTVTDKQ